MRSFPTSRSVSYTHLDVYKRQVLAENAFSNAEDKYGSLSTAAKNIISASDKYTSGAKLSDSAVTVESLKQWQAGSIIIWSGHGGYIDRFKECFVTGEDLTEKNMEQYKDCLLYTSRCV